MELNLPLCIEKILILEDGGSNEKSADMGAGGFIASHLVKSLKRDGCWVRGVDLK